MTAPSIWKSWLFSFGAALQKPAILLSIAALVCAPAMAQQAGVHPTMLQLPPAAPPAPATHVTPAAPTIRAPAASISTMDGLSTLTHVEIGHLLLLHPSARVTRIYVADPAVLDSYVGDPRQIVLTGKGPGVTSVVLWDEFGRTQTYTISVDLNLDYLRTALQHALPNDKIDVQASEGKVILAGTVSTRATADTAVRLATLFSKDVIVLMFEMADNLRETGMSASSRSTAPSWTNTASTSSAPIGAGRWPAPGAPPSFHRRRSPAAPARVAIAA